MLQDFKSIFGILKIYHYFTVVKLFLAFVIFLAPFCYYIRKDKTHKLPVNQNHI